MVPEFSEEYFRDLPPRDRRYDSPVADQLVFSVFPNGVKAWVHVYPCEDYVRRRTMGLFPEMSYADAVSALDVSRRIAEVDSRQVRRPRRKPSVALRTLATALAAAVLASVLTYALLKKDTPSHAVIDSVRPAGGTEPAAAASVDEPADDPIFVDEVAPVIITLPDTDTETSVPPESGAQSELEQSAPTEAEATNTAAGQVASETIPETVAEAVTETAGEADPEAGDDQESSPEAETSGVTGSAVEAVGQQTDSDSTQEPESEPPPSVLPETEPAPSALPDSGPARAEIRGVARGQLTNAVQDREPVDLVEGRLSLPADRPLKLFYFTEVRGMNGQSVVHRWTLDREIVSEKTFAIGGDRWRVFSSKSLDAGDAGSWRASTMDATGAELHATDLRVE